ncbi:MAG: FkbM family methyltransferase [Oscillospiraceae bacterium]|nr:FkbM family methyltransferase [Oscillospiraceae bacterium]
MQSIWQYLSGAEKPVVIYGMGNGADRILAQMEARGITPSAFMASDEFVRGHSFRGFTVKKLSDIEAEYSDFIIIIAFGTNRPDVLERIYSLSEKYEVLVPDIPVCGDGLFDLEYAAQNAERIRETRELFADGFSKEVFNNLIRYKVSGRLEPLCATISPREEALALLDLKDDGSEVFLDFGAYDGDTAEEFTLITGGNFNKIYAFEPDFKNFCKLRRKHYMLPPDKLEAINAAVWDKDGEESFSQAGGRQSAVGSGRKIKTIKADTFCAQNKIKPTYIKFDVEGSEAAALSGAADILRRHKPKLSVSLYHRTEDLLELPALINKINGRYKMYLRRHEYIPAWDINLYCV